MSSRLKQLRTEKKLTQTELVELIDLNITRAHIGNIENNRANPSIGVLKEFARIFDVSVDYILGLTDVKKYEDYDLKDIILNVDSLNYDGQVIKKEDRETVIEILESRLSLIDLLDIKKNKE